MLSNYTGYCVSGIFPKFVTNSEGEEKLTILAHSHLPLSGVERRTNNVQKRCSRYIVLPPCEYKYANISNVNVETLEITITDSL